MKLASNFTTKDTKITRGRGLAKANEPDVSRIVVDACYKIHSTLGPGLLEKAYEGCLEYELLKRNLKIERQKKLPVRYEEIVIDEGFRLDLVVEDELVIELKAQENLVPVHVAQLMTYLKLTGIKTGLLVNFSVPLIKDGIKRYSI